MGTLATSGLPDDDEIAIPLRILIGSGLTGFALALFAAGGMVTGGVIVAGFAAAIALLMRHARVLAMLRQCAHSCGELRKAPILFAAVVVTAALMWISAIAPPRSADAMRYHLAHIRLIVAEGRWSGIPDFHFALPFGWTLSFLPFELLGIPQGAQLLSVALWLVIASSLIRALRKAGAGPVATGIPLLLMLHPFVARTFSEAGADPYSLLVVLVVALLLSRAEALTPLEAGALGFAAWVGIQSRYQLVAVGISATVVFIIAIRRAPDRNRLLRRALAGSVVAAALASPFYIANAKWLGNPVWPLMIGRGEAESSFANLVAWHYARSLAGYWTFADLSGAILKLLTWPRLFPVALVIVICAVAFMRSGQPRLRRISAFSALFLCLWLTVQPLLYPKFVLMILPATALCIGFWLTTRSEPRGRGWRPAQVAIDATVSDTAAVTGDSLRFLTTGDRDAYHRHTWFYPVYKWINSRTPEDSRVLAILTSGPAYYMEREYRRGDPWIGGSVDWLRVKDGRTLAAVLERDGYTHVVYEDRDWELYPGGAEMKDAIGEAAALGFLRPVQTFDLRLYTSRARRTWRDARVSVLAVGPIARSWPDPDQLPVSMLDFQVQLLPEAQESAILR
jgi:hypothetical protein